MATKKIARRAEKFLLTLFLLAKTDRFKTSAGLFFRLSLSVLLYLPPTKGCKTALIGEKKDTRRHFVRPPSQALVLTGGKNSVRLTISNKGIHKFMFIYCSNAQFYLQNHLKTNVQPFFIGSPRESAPVFPAAVRVYRAAAYWRRRILLRRAEGAFR